jgi:hypothetical protein
LLFRRGCRSSCLLRKAAKTECKKTNSDPLHHIQMPAPIINQRALVRPDRSHLQVDRTKERAKCVSLRCWQRAHPGVLFKLGRDIGRSVAMKGKIQKAELKRRRSISEIEV